jgi:hypothetical protein
MVAAKAGRYRVKPLQHLESRHDGHVDVARDEVRHGLENRDKSFVTVMRHRHVKAAAREIFGDHLGHCSVVIDAKNFLSSFSHTPPPLDAISRPAGPTFLRFLSGNSCRMGRGRKL